MGWWDEDPLIGGPHPRSIFGHKGRLAKLGAKKWARLIAGCLAVLVVVWYVPYGSGIMAAATWGLVIAIPRKLMRWADEEFLVVLIFLALFFSFLFYGRPDRGLAPLSWR